MAKKKAAKKAEPVSETPERKPKKAEAIRAYIGEHPDAPAKEVAEAVATQLGVKCVVAEVYMQKSKMNRKADPKEARAMAAGKSLAASLEAAQTLLNNCADSAEAVGIIRTVAKMLGRK